ncbi:MAG TPA: alpha/beta hydrolase [Polyangiaceae bacterium LLY-WYZ-15_(1-7)]|nr:alpha/beta hydrolase [Polyangiaceae bacterium LLY-WYZ-15_(1-7)]HJL12679.1 alpha/beta hydrolase [Polyangiaceae bacterium LLY-WYZ-15_(1-7)]
MHTGTVSLGIDERGEGAPLVLLMGLAWPRTYWDEGFCDALAARGFRVLRVDHRDVGESDFLDVTPPNIGRVVQAAFAGEPVDAPYLLADMARDVVGLLDALELERAHLVGASLGGMVAQTLAIAHPERVASLTSVMSSTGDPEKVLASTAALDVLFTPIPTEREAAIAHQVEAFRTLSGAAFDEARVRALAARGFDLQAHVPGLQRQQGAARQLVALLASGPRVEALPGVEAPSLVVHGAEDPLVPLEAGEQTAALIPGAELLVLEGMGHDVAPPFWAPVADAIAALR